MTKLIFIGTQNRSFSHLAFLTSFLAALLISFSTYAQLIKAQIIPVFVPPITQNSEMFLLGALGVFSGLWGLSTLFRSKRNFTTYPHLQRIRPWAWLALFGLVFTILLNYKEFLPLPVKTHPWLLLCDQYSHITLFSYLALLGLYLLSSSGVRLLGMMTLILVGLITTTTLINPEPFPSLWPMINYSILLTLLFLAITTLLLQIYRKSPYYW